MSTTVAKNQRLKSAVCLAILPTWLTLLVQRIHLTMRTVFMSNYAHRIPLFFTLLLLPTGAFGQEEGSALPVMPGEEEIEVVVAPSTKELDPVGVPEAACVEAGEKCTSVISILRNDLTLSGFFHVVNPDTYLVTPDAHPIDSPKWSAWVDVGAKYLVKTRLSRSGEGFDLEFRLQNVVDKEHIATKADSFKGISAARLRPSTHAFANAVIEVLTGQPGLFGSRIAYSAKHPGGLAASL